MCIFHDKLNCLVACICVCIPDRGENLGSAAIAARRSCCDVCMHVRDSAYRSLDITFTADFTIDMSTFAIVGAAGSSDHVMGSPYRPQTRPQATISTGSSQDPLFASLGSPSFRPIVPDHRERYVPSHFVDSSHKGGLSQPSYGTNSTASLSAMSPRVSANGSVLSSGSSTLTVAPGVSTLHLSGVSTVSDGSDGIRNMQQPTHALQWRSNMHISALGDSSSSYPNMFMQAAPPLLLGSYPQPIEATMMNGPALGSAQLPHPLAMRIPLSATYPFAISSHANSMLGHPMLLTAPSDQAVFPFVVPPGHPWNVNVAAFDPQVSPLPSMVVDQPFGAHGDAAMAYVNATPTDYMAPWRIASQRPLFGLPPTSAMPGSLIPYAQAQPQLSLPQHVQHGHHTMTMPSSQQYSSGSTPDLGNNSVPPKAANTSEPAWVQEARQAELREQVRRYQEFMMGGPLGSDAFVTPAVRQASLATQLPPPRASVNQQQYGPHDSQTSQQQRLELYQQRPPVYPARQQVPSEHAVHTGFSGLLSSNEAVRPVMATAVSNVTAAAQAANLDMLKARAPSSQHQSGLEPENAPRTDVRGRRLRVPKDEMTAQMQSHLRYRRRITDLMTHLRRLLGVLLSLENQPQESTQDNVLDHAVKTLTAQAEVINMLSPIDLLTRNPSLGAMLGLPPSSSPANSSLALPLASSTAPAHLYYQQIGSSKRRKAQDEVHRALFRSWHSLWFCYCFAKDNAGVQNATNASPPSATQPESAAVAEHSTSSHVASSSPSISNADSKTGTVNYGHGRFHRSVLCLPTPCWFVF